MFIKGKNNVIADMLSRHDQILKSEWMLEKKMFKWILSHLPSAWTGSWIVRKLDDKSTPTVHVAVSGRKGHGSKSACKLVAEWIDIVCIPTFDKYVTSLAKDSRKTTT